jgi:hypothetical protein
LIDTALTWGMPLMLLAGAVRAVLFQIDPP